MGIEEFSLAATVGVCAVLISDWEASTIWSETSVPKTSFLTILPEGPEPLIRRETSAFSQLAIFRARGEF